MLIGELAERATAAAPRPADPRDRATGGNVLQESGTGSLITVTDDTFAEAVLASDRPVVVDFWADWCPPCKMIAKSLAELAGELGERIVVATLNSDENPNDTRTSVRPRS